MEIVDRKEMIKLLLKEYSTIEEQLEIDNLMHLDMLQSYYFNEKKYTIATKFNEKKKKLIKF